MVAKVQDGLVDNNSIYLLEVGYYISPIKPKDYSYDHAAIDPNMYFITSGDAVEKSKAMIRDIQSLLDAVADSGNENDHLSEIISQQLDNAKRMLRDLLIIKADNCFLETEWNDHDLYCITKNPRNR